MLSAVQFNLLYNRKNFTLVSNICAFLKHFVRLTRHLSLGTSLGVNICRRFNAVSICISYKTYKSATSPTVLQNDLGNVYKKQMSLGNGIGIAQLTTRISEFSCCRYSVKIFCIRSGSFFKSRLFIAKFFRFCYYNTLDKKLLFEIYAVIFHFVQTRMKRTYLGN